MSRERARATIQVEPNHAACYWQAISETLIRIGAQHAHLEISVVDVALAPGSQEIVLQMSSVDLDQATLQAAIDQTILTCAGSTHQPGDEVEQPGASHPSASNAPFTVRPGVTVSWPLDARLDRTIEAPLRPTPNLEPGP